MKTFYAQIKKAPLMYVSSDGDYKKINVEAIKDVNIPNSFDIPYVRGAVGLFNVIISRMMYFSEYGANKQKRSYPKAQEFIYLPAHQISNMINRCESQSYNIIRSLERILDIYVSRAHEKAGANTFRLSQRVYEFLHIFTPGKLNDFINKYNIAPEDQYALKQLYNYRVVRPSDANMDRVEREEYHSFIRSRRHRNFVHFCAQNNVSIQSRVNEIELHINLLSERQLEQLNKIKSFLSEGIKKLANYFHWKLLDIQQYITMMLKKDKATKTETNRNNDSSDSQPIDRNQTEKEQQKTHEVAAQHLKDPEDVPFQEITQIASYWNIMANGRDMEIMYTLSEKKIESIVRLVKSHGKEKILNAIQNTGNLMLNNTLMFKDFVKNSIDPDSRFNKIHRIDNPDTRLTESQLRQNKDKMYKFRLNHSVVSHDKVPSFKTKAEAKSWFKANTKNM